MSCTFPSLNALKDVFGKNALLLEHVKATGRPIAGTLCIYTPTELLLAAGCVPVSLCGTRQDAIPAAEAHLPRTLCPLVKSTYGVLLDDSCPYMSAADFVVADSTCDGKKKMYELLSQRKELFLLQLPQCQGERQIGQWRLELERLRDMLEARFGALSNQAIFEAMRVCNRERLALQRIFQAARHRPSPLSGRDLIEIGSRIGFVPDREQAATLLEALADELEAWLACPETAGTPAAPRILVTGVPMGMGTHKVIHLLEACGASVVCIDNCSAYKKTRLIYSETELATAENDPLGVLAAKTLAVPCAVMSPNPGRYESLAELIPAFGVQGVVNLTWQGCQPFEIEAYSVGTFVKDQWKLPYLHLISDYSEHDTEPLKVRMEAFLELIAARSPLTA